MASYTTFFFTTCYINDLMAFFGFEQSSLEGDRQAFLQGASQNTEDLAVYTWGEESYDGLGDALQEGGDELNDETFGGAEPVGQSDLVAFAVTS